MTIREIFISLGFEVDRASESQANSNIENLRDTADNLLSNLTLGFNNSEIGEVVNSFRDVSDEIDEATSGTRGLDEAQEDLVDTLEDVAESYDRVTESLEDMTESGGDIDDVVEITEDWIEANDELVDTLEEVRQGYEDLEQSIPDDIEIDVTLNPEVDSEPTPIPIEGDPNPLPIPSDPHIDPDSEDAFVSNLQGLKDMATKIIGVISIFMTLANVNEIIEEFSAVNQQILSATKGMADLESAQSTILESANEIRMSYESTAGAVSDLVASSPEIFSTVEDAAAYNEACVKLFKSAGKSNEEVESLVEAIGISYKKGAVDSGTISTLLEQSPEAVELLNAKLGTTTDQLEELAGEGGISLQDLTDAFMENADSIDEAFGDVKFNISDALLNIRNQWGFWLADMDETYGITETIGTAMVQAFSAGLNILTQVASVVGTVVEAFGGIENVMKLIGIITAVVLGNMMIPKIMAVVSAIMSMDKALLLAKAKMIGMMAVVVLIALLIEDFISFMKGEDSVIGALFEKAGIDAEEARQVIISAWEAVKAFLFEAWLFILQQAQMITTAMAQWWTENGESVKASLEQIWTALCTLLTVLWTALQATAIAVFTALQVFWETWGGTILSIFETLWNTMIGLITPFLDALAALITFIASVFTGDFEGAWNAVKDLLQAIWDAIVVIITGACEILTSITETMSTVLQSIFTALHDAISTIVGNIATAIQDGFQTAIDWITALPAQAVTWGKDIILGIVDGIKGAMSMVTDAVSDVASNIKSVLGFSVPEKGPLSNFDTYMPDMIDLMVEGIEGTKNKVMHSVENLAGDMSDGVNQEITPPDIVVPDIEKPNVPTPDAVDVPVSMNDLGTLPQPSVTAVSPETKKVAAPQIEAPQEATEATYREERTTTQISKVENPDTAEEIGKTDSKIKEYLTVIQTMMSMASEKLGSMADKLTTLLDNLAKLVGVDSPDSDGEGDDGDDTDTVIIPRGNDGEPDDGGNKPQETDPPSYPNPPDYPDVELGGVEVKQPLEKTGDGENSSPFSSVVTMLKGVADTVVENKTLIISAVDKFLALSGDTQATAVASPDTINRAEGGQAVSNINISQNVEINNDFHGDVAGQQKSSEAMDKATKDTSGELARALAFAK